MTKITLRSDKLPSSKIQIPISRLSNNLYTLPNNILIIHFQELTKSIDSIQLTYAFHMHDNVVLNAYQAIYSSNFWF